MFSYFEHFPTFLVFMAVLIGIVITLMLTPVLIKILKREHLGQQVRDDGPQTHLVKSGTPTMGGIVMLLAVAVAAFAVGVPDPETYLLLAAVLLTGVVGLVDDISSIAHERSLGLTPKAKLACQFLISLGFILCAVNMLDVSPVVDIPFICQLDLGVLTTVIPLGDGEELRIPWLYVIFCLILLMGLSNAVNLTDGLDGLASGTVMMVMIVMAAIAFRQNLLEPAIFSAAIAGACVGFLWFNSHPADIFMGDTGSLALGQALGCLAVVTKTEFLVIIIGGLFVAEALSVMIQVAHFQRTGKRVFLMAPLHHHFEKKGWSETKVVVRFWIISGLLAACGFVLYFSSSLVMA